MRVEARSGSSRVHSLVMNYLVLVNPLVYVAKGMRDALTPEVPRMPLPVSMSALLLIATLFWSAGSRNVRARATL
jgi:ABC-type polysaccharide/polyol phosphate export permease